MSKLLEPELQANREEATAIDGQTGAVRACRILLRGRVQGVGMRPTIARLAQGLELNGVVQNCQSGVRIHVEGAAAQVRQFCDRLPASVPTGSRVDEIKIESVAPASQNGFYIEPSTTDDVRRAEVPPDLATCAACSAEVAESSNRRFAYLFTTCTHCGPRYSLIDAMPYDRQSTGMSPFDQCPACASEYGDSAQRRFHSQTNSCPNCGPHLWLTDAQGRATCDEPLALAQAVAALRQGKIVAVKGIGGYQLMADASSPQVVEEFRHRKQRRGKPLAVMVRDLMAAETIAVLASGERAALASAENPIVVVPLRTPPGVSPLVAEGLSAIGLMLPTSPLHAYLVREAQRPLVVTSGNREGEPLAFDAATAAEQLGQVADFFLHHDRPIRRPIDDSVVRIVAGRSATIRLARGLAPLPLDLKSERPILALGAHQKAAIALTSGTQSMLAPHVGDLNGASARSRFVSQIASMCRLYAVEPSVLVHDCHPDYFTSRWASEQSLPSLAVQHHHAHVAAGMLEHGWLDRQVLGVAWDGTGYGADATIWGGEFLLTTATEFRRVACLRPFCLPGGDAAIRQPWRVAVALIQQTLGLEIASQWRFPQVPAANVAQVAQLAGKQRLCPTTTSAGRLFDGVAAMLLGIAQSRYEGEPAMLLEAACDLSASGSYELTLCSGQPAHFDWRPLIAELWIDLQNNVPTGTIAMKFHRALAASIFAFAGRFSELPVVLAGGCIHNRVLTELVAEQFADSGQPLGLPGVIPVNDGGLAAGQLAVAIARLRAGERLCV